MTDPVGAKAATLPEALDAVIDMCDKGAWGFDPKVLKRALKLLKAHLFPTPGGTK